MEVIYGIGIGLLVAALIVGAYARWRIRKSRLKRAELLAQVPQGHQYTINEGPIERYDGPEPAEEAPRAIDPHNPPKMVTYNPKTPSVRLCTCHGDRIAPGDQVMLWPIPNHPEGGMDVFCSRTITDAEREQR